MEKETKTLREQLGAYLIDVSKLTFGGVVLSVILEITKSKLLILGVGFMATVIFAAWGFLLIKTKKS